MIQVRAADREAVESVLAQHGLADCVHYVGQAVSGDRFVITANGQTVFSESRTTLRVWWAETTWQMQRLRDNPECADQEHQAKSNDADPGLNVKLSFDINEDVAAPYIATGARPKVAVLREQGVNSHVEMAAAFHRAGFDAIDVHMSDLLTGRTGWKISTPRSRAVVSPTVMCWVPVKVGRSQSCSMTVYAMSLQPSSTVRKRWRWGYVTVAR